ncbi:MAG: MFS transporter [Anaerolineae bacterium]|nr:MFS transporter [Anaerolineae bacterium]
MKKAWPFSFFFVFFAAIASFSPYMVPYFQSLDFNGSQIGLLTAVPPLIILFMAPFWTKLADSTNRHKLIMGISLLISAGGLILFTQATTFLAVLAVAILFNIFSAPILSFANSAAVFMLGTKKELFGRLRLGGTIGFGITAFIVGVLVEDNGIKLAFWIASGLLFTGFLISLQLLYRNEDSKDTDDAKAENQVENQSIGSLLKNPRWLLFLTIAFTGGVALTAANNYFFPFMKEIGASQTTMGLTLSIGTIVEIPVLLFSNLFIRRFKAYGVLVFSTFMTGLRFILFALAGDPAAVMVIQILNGFTFPLLSVAGVAYADENAPEALRSTAQGLFNAALMGVGAAVGGLVSGLLLEKMGAQGLYMTVGAAILLILAIVMAVHSRLAPEPEVVY